MKVRRLDNKGDWTFGNGLANYAKENEAILQNVATRIKSFKGDWFLDNEANIDWFRLLSTKDTKQIIINEIERVTLETEGVIRIVNLEFMQDNERKAVINLILDTIYTTDIKIGVKI